MLFGTNVHSQASSDTGRPGRPTVSVRPVASIPDRATVRDYDQLSPRAMAAFPAIVDSGRLDVSPRVASDLEGGEIINFVGYYRIEVEG